MLSFSLYLLIPTRSSISRTCSFLKVFICILFIHKASTQVCSLFAQMRMPYSSNCKALIYNQKVISCNKKSVLLGALGSNSSLNLAFKTWYFPFTKTPVVGNGSTLALELIILALVQLSDDLSWKILEE